LSVRYSAYFFFSSRRRHTRFSRDWSSDVCSSDLERLGNTVLLKREDLQPVFSFKIRGAYNKLKQLTDEQRARGVVAASAGNHAQGLAFAARHMGVKATIVMPKTTPEIKVKAVRARGGKVVLHG